MTDMLAATTTSADAQAISAERVSTVDLQPDVIKAFKIAQREYSKQVAAGGPARTDLAMRRAAEALRANPIDGITELGHLKPDTVTALALANAAHLARQRG
jgi:1,6-anhydro-N-acetylmuramate kinase